MPCRRVCFDSWIAVGAALCGAACHANSTASCRVENLLSDGERSLGSGTLVDVAADGERGLVLTCAHLFGAGSGQIVVTFPNGRRHGGLLVARDAAADLAAVEIAHPTCSPAEVHFGRLLGNRYTACGYGPRGRRRCVTGESLGVVVTEARENLQIRAAVRSGDSGGGVFDQQGHLAAVVWGVANGVTYASTGAPLQAFLQRLLPSAAAAAGRPGRSTCRIVEWDSCAPDTPTGSRPPAVPHAPPRQEAPRESPSGAPAAIDGSWAARWVLWYAGPPGAAACAAMIAWRLFKRRRREATAAAERGFPGAAETEASPIERDDREARQLLQLSQLEGRDPLQDALAGRLALDRLDEIAERAANDQHAQFADDLRRELRERFNDVAPTNFPPTAAD